MKKSLSPARALLLFALTVSAQTAAVKFRLHIVLIDRDLNQKPVPNFVVTLQRTDTAAKETIELKTGLDGIAEKPIPAGRYAVATPHPIEFQGKRYSWTMEIAVAGTAQTLELTNDNAKSEDAAAETSRGGDLTEQFKRLKNSVVTVWSEFGKGTGFFTEPAGLVLTNQHVVGSSEYLAVQFDPERKVEARLLAADSQKDIAVLWVNPTAFKEAVLAPLAKSEAGKSAVMEGERVFTIGSPLTQQKILTTGVVSKVDAHTIISDVNINPGNSGGPLFNSAGLVVGLTTFGQRGEAGPGISGIVRIEEALLLVEQSRSKMTGTPPSAALLLVEPAKPYPIEGLKPVLQVEKFDTSPYLFGAGDFNVRVSTPVLEFRESQEERLNAERQRAKRNKKKGGAAQEAPATTEEPKDWEAAAGERKAVIEIVVFPKAKESFWGSFARNMAAAQGMYSPAKLKFKTDFYRMRLLCGEKEVQPIRPGKIPLVLAVNNASVSINDSASFGAYTYLPDAIAPTCGQTVLEIYPSKSALPPVVKTLDPKTVEKVWSDFEAFRKAQAGSSKGLDKP